MQPQITVINPIKESEKTIRAAAYVRVSTSKEDQLNSFAAQYIHYKKMIEESNSEELVDVYADEGISGTVTKNRDAFNRLMDDCEKGKINRIYTKSISRFARNTTECLKYIRLLKSLGITVFFEKENLDTANEETEFRLTLLESHAQEESISISKNVRMGEQYRMESGEYLLKNTLYGYDLVNHKLVINEAEAQIVRRIYSDYIAGKGVKRIYHELNDEQVPKSGKIGIWSRRCVEYILRNEKYIGDQLYRKRCRTETFPFKSKKNYGEVDSYYVEDSHPAIIDKATFEAAQALRLARRPKNADMISSPVPLSGKIKCAKCGSTFRQINIGETRYWGCGTYYNDTRRCDVKKIPESEIYSAFVTLYNKLKQNKKVILQPVVTQLVSLKSSIMAQSLEFAVIDEKIMIINDQLAMMAQLRQKGLMDEQTFRSKSNELNNSLNSLRSKRRLFLNNNEADKAITSIKSLMNILDKGPDKLIAFDEELYDSMVKGITADDSDTIKFTLIGGLVINEKIERKTRK